MVGGHFRVCRVVVLLDLGRCAEPVRVTPCDGGLFVGLGVAPRASCML